MALIASTSTIEGELILTLPASYALETDLDKNKRKIIVCTTGESKSTMEHGFELKKTGIHIIWPHVYVDEQYAKFLRSVIIQYFENNLPKRPEYCQWDQVFDYAVISSSGLRMKGSAKIMRCTGCKNKKGDRECCEICYGQGKIIPGKGRIYLPRLILDGEGNRLNDELEKMKKNELQEICLDKGLTKSGKKAALVERIILHEFN